MWLKRVLHGTNDGANLPESSASKSVISHTLTHGAFYLE